MTTRTRARVARKVARLSKLSRFEWLGKAVLAAALVGAAPSAFAGVEEISLGVSIPQPLGSANETITRPASFAGEAWFQTPNALPEEQRSSSALGRGLPFAEQNASVDGNPIQPTWLAVYVAG